VQRSLRSLRRTRVSSDCGTDCGAVGEYRREAEPRGAPYERRRGRIFRAQHTTAWSV